MKVALIGILVLIACALGWAFQHHPEAFQDAVADIDQDSNGLRAQLVKEQKENETLTATNAALAGQNDVLQANLKNLSDQVAQLKKAISSAASAASTEAAAPPASAATGPGKTFVPPSPLPQKENWTWVAIDGKTYKNVVVLKVEADCVTILDDEGGGRVYIVTLPPDIQKLLNYDPDLARIAGEARVKDDIANQQMLSTEKVQTQKAHTALMATDQPNAASTAPSNPTSMSAGDKQVVQQQISDLQTDIRQKLKQIAQDFANDGYSRVSSHSAYEDAVAKEAQQVNDLQAKLGLTKTSFPVYYPYYPYYYYAMP